MFVNVVVVLVAAAVVLDGMDGGDHGPKYGLLCSTPWKKTETHNIDVDICWAILK